MTIEFPPRPVTKDELLSRIESQGDSLKRLVESLSPRQTTIVLDEWSVKDHLAHLGVWLGAAGAALNRQPMWQGLDLPQPPADPRDWDAINGTVYGLWADVPLARVLNAWGERYAEAVAAIEDASTEKLFLPHVELDAPEGLTVIDVVSANTYEHFMEHETWMREQLIRHGVQL